MSRCRASSSSTRTIPAVGASRATDSSAYASRTVPMVRSISSPNALRGATIVGGDIDEAGAETTAKEITGDGGRAVAQRVDVTKRADVDALVDRAQADFGRVDIMGNIAGVPHNKMVVDCTDDEFERILA